MTTNSNQKTSLLISSQLPEFIRDDASYENFVLFVEAYYEWMEQNGKALERSKNLLNYKDIDNTPTEFLDYFYDEFLSYFPKEILADKNKVTKIAKELYKTKGTPASYKFLFRILYNSDVEFFYTKDAVLKASSGKWYVTKSLRLDSSDVNFLNIKNYRLFGETTKTIATVENAILTGGKIEIFISDVKRLFQSGETIRVVDVNNQNILFGGQTLTAKIVGQISAININPNNRGLLYQPGDPVIVYGGLNSNTAPSAIAEVKETTKGSIKRILVDDGGYGYRADPNTAITIADGGGATAIVGSLDPAGEATVSFIPTDYIGKKRLVRLDADNYLFSANAVADINTTLANAFTFISLTTFPISSVLIQNSGGGTTKLPTITAESYFPLEDGVGSALLKNLGILAPIQIDSAGEGYAANDQIALIGGIGYGASANVVSVGASGEILSVGYTYQNNNYPLGGMGHRLGAGMPTPVITSANGAGAVLRVPGILGEGAVFSSIVDRVGSITSIKVTNYGEDYISTPNVSLKVQDFVVTGLSRLTPPEQYDVIYQGDNFTEASYVATVDSIELLVPSNDIDKQLYRVRVYNYTATPNYSLPLKIKDKAITLTMSNAYASTNPKYNSSTGVTTYGDGTAKATAEFLNGLVISQGQYLDSSGQPSSFNVLQSENYNNYTYEIKLEKEIAKYKKILLNLLHPTGMKVLGKYAVKSQEKYNTEIIHAGTTGHTLGYYTGNPLASGAMETTYDTKSTNIVTFDGLVGADLVDFISTNNAVTITSDSGFVFHSEVLAVRGLENVDFQTTGDPDEDLMIVTGTEDLLTAISANTITLKDNVWLTYANVGFVSTNTNTNVINIRTLRNPQPYDMVNNGNYSDPNYPIRDIIRVGDNVAVETEDEKLVTSVDYVNSRVYVSSNLTNTSANSRISVRRTINTTNVQIFGPAGTQYFPELLTEAGDNLVTEDNRLILLG